MKHLEIKPIIKEQQQSRGFKSETTASVRNTPKPKWGEICLYELQMFSAFSSDLNSQRRKNYKKAHLTL